jgi:surfeit locus 1 family protein
MSLKILFGRKWIISTLLALVGAAVCIRLGIWQLDRLEQRRAFNAHYLATANLPELDLNNDSRSDLPSMEYRPVTVRGRYDFSNQVALLNFYKDGEYGYDLLTPLHLADGRAVLVERGWIPGTGNETRDGWSRYDEKADVTVRGVIRLGVTKTPIGGQADPTPVAGQSRLDFWNFINIQRLSTQIPYPILPVYIQPAAGSSDNSPPIPARVEIEISEGPHFGYALQWFAFAAILIIGYPFFVRRQETASR